MFIGEKADKNRETNGKLQTFLDSSADMYAILQLKRTNDTISEGFESYESLKNQGKEPDIDHYQVVYMAPLSSYTDQIAVLEELYTKFNLDHPKDFRGHSLSISDIVALKANGEVSFHYVDIIGFEELQGFLKPENYLRNEERPVSEKFYKQARSHPERTEEKQRGSSGRSIGKKLFLCRNRRYRVLPGKFRDDTGGTE